MRPYNRPLLYIVGLLIAVGLIVEFLSNPAGMIIPIVVFGVIFYFYKFPPKRHSDQNQRYQKPPGRSKPKPKSKKAVFRVIKGNKKEEDDEPPRYH